jgi:prepilin-type processing-associated H-X9-DG protein
MPIYDISRVGWPPGKNSTGGLGLYLDAKTIRMARAANSADSPDFVPAIKTSMVPDPTDTALLVEHISILNALWTTKDACVVSADAQFDAKTFSAKDFHGGKMNYLMLDGHVELMSPAQSTGLIGGVWTIRKGD